MSLAARALILSRARLAAAALLIAASPASALDGRAQCATQGFGDS